MKTLSLKLEDQIFKDAEGVISEIKKSRNRYINEAVDYYNRYNKRKIIASKLANESKLVQEESMSVLAEFERIGHED
jgi:metal-responsive CopG/Arc/MetJ family transcriptional regulator